jgi:uncharacterized Tic20 family protein
MLSHFGLIALYFVGPLVIRLTIGKDNAYVKHHATEALNAQITFGILWNVCGIGAMVFVGITDNDMFIWLMLGVGASFIWILVTSILGAMHAWRGDWWRYPGSVRLVRGAVRNVQTPRLEREEPS